LEDARCNGRGRRNRTLHGYHDSSPSGIGVNSTNRALWTGDSGTLGGFVGMRREWRFDRVVLLAGVSVIAGTLSDIERRFRIPTMRPAGERLTGIALSDVRPLVVEGTDEGTRARALIAVGWLRDRVEATAAGSFFRTFVVLPVSPWCRSWQTSSAEGRSIVVSGSARAAAS
jgi:hypothetical protein